ncbi:hypothetical protein [Streptomyces sp. NPDC058045]|uniref:hypothetical protein n=1 Tax=Streptomyces sp. NPDC058045 TaxID=3346311 RepID=UPI0036EDD601
MENAIAYRKSPGWDVRPYDDLSHAFLFRAADPFVLILDTVSLYIMELCTSHTPAGATEKLTSALSGKMSAEASGRFFEKTTRQLLHQGVIESATGQEEQ